MSTSFHPQTDEASKQVNRSVGQILQTLILLNQSDWVDKLPFMEFSINSNISSLMGFTPFELNYGYMPSLIGGIIPFENAKPGIKSFINQALTNFRMAHDAIVESWVNQTRQSNKWQKAETPFMVGDKVYLSTQNLNLPKSRARKLMPKFIGPYKVTDSPLEISRYTLDLPPELKAQRIVPLFHVHCHGLFAPHPQYLTLHRPFIHHLQ